MSIDPAGPSRGIAKGDAQLVGELSTPYRTLDGALAGMSAIEQRFRAARDRRAIFLTAYLVITRALKQQVATGAFRDSDWVASYGTGFANLYRQALLDWERGARDDVPKAWRIAFEVALAERALVIQDLLLGINAHINHDLALALVEATVDPRRDERYADHTAVNAVLQAATNTLQDRICLCYMPALKLLDVVGEGADELIASFSVAKAREEAWTSALALVNGRDEQERSGTRRSIDQRAAVLARLILAPNPAYPWLVGALRHLERMQPWWSSFDGNP